MDPKRQLDELCIEIIQCRKCPRLVRYRKSVAKEKRRQFAHEEYWGKPVPGFGDPNARLMVIGLAPAAHGGNRTGRVFTGDNSARFLVSHLNRAGFASQPVSENRNDGLFYMDCYITAAVRCVPPENKPTIEEMDNCFPFLEKEFSLLRNAKVILALGKIAFDSMIDLAKKHYGARGRFDFKHGGKYQLAAGFPVVFASYHPSPRNTNTGKMTSKMFSRVLDEINQMLERSVTPRMLAPA